MFKIRKCGSLRCEVCASLLTDGDWEKTPSGDLQRGSIRVYPETGEIEQDGVLVPMGRWERRCVRKCLRKRAEARFKVNRFTPTKTKR